VPNRINSWSYDAAGNVLQVGGMTRSFTYDAEDRQVSATINGNTSTYSYDGLGERVMKVTGGKAPCPPTKADR
jgi:YD repeat-containing protein